MATTTVNGVQRDEEKRVIFASSLGTVFEWYDFYLYATLAPFFARLFFPPGNDTAALHSMTSLTGSALLALAADAGALSASEAWRAAHIDEDWNMEHWGEDAEAVQRRVFRKAEMMAAAALLRTLPDPSHP